MAEVEGKEQLTDIFGEWPSFHDAEILSLSLDRSGEDGPTLEARIHIFEMTSDVDSAGLYLLRNHTLVTLLFTRVVLRRLDGFNGQNVIFSLDISPIDPERHEGRHFSVELASSYGAGVSLDCERMIVRDVGPRGTAVS